MHSAATCKSKSGRALLASRESLESKHFLGVSWPSVVRGNWTRVFLFCCILVCLLFLICIEFVYLYFPVLFCLSVSVKWLAVKTASEWPIVSSGALNSTPTNLGVNYSMTAYLPTSLWARWNGLTEIAGLDNGGQDIDGWIWVITCN